MSNRHANVVHNVYGRHGLMSIAVRIVTKMSNVLEVFHRAEMRVTAVPTTETAILNVVQLITMSNHGKFLNVFN